MALPYKEFANFYSAQRMASSSTLNNPTDLPPFIVASEVMRRFMDMVERVARHSGTVLIVGETGTGKERIAHSIHENSMRSAHPFIDINCAALPEHLVESELFGYEKGAFSGASAAKPGLFEIANQGTIFLDEIGELDLKVQVKLLRVLDRTPYYRLGGSRKVITDVRVVAATNRNLKEEVSAGRFRKDLYHRLSQFELSVPPLRDRPDDVIALAQHLLTQEREELTFSPEALRLLQDYPWPGNVRELRNVVNKLAFSVSERCSIIDPSKVADELEALTSHEAPRARPGSEVPSSSLSARIIRQALEASGGHRGQAAVQLGISRRTLSRKLKDLGLSPSKAIQPDRPGESTDDGRQHFRADVKVPATLITIGGRAISCSTTNLGSSGMGLDGISVPLSYGSVLRLQLLLPGTAERLEVMCTLAWADKNGSAGIIFTDTNAAVRQKIRKWLNLQMEGDSVAASATGRGDIYPELAPR